MKLLTSALKEVFGDKANIYIGETGFVLRLEIKCAMSEKEIAERALISGVAVKESGTGKKYPQILLLCSSVASEDFCRLQKDFTAVYSEHKNVSKTLFVCCITRFTVIKYQQ